MSVSRIKIVRFLKTLAKIIISCLALSLVFRKTDLDSLWNLLKQSDIYLLTLAGIFFILSKLLSAIRLNYFFRAIGVSLSEKLNIKLYWLGMFYNLFLPGGIGGDGYKVYYLHKKFNTPVKKGIIATLFDRLSGLLSLGLVCIVFALIMPQKVIAGAYLIGLTIIGVATFYFVVYKWFNSFFYSLNQTNLLALGTQISQVITAWLILKALGNDQQMQQYLFVFLISSVIAVIPFTVGGIGAREVTFLYAARIFDLSLPVSVALSLLFFFITAVVSFFGVFYTFRKEKPELVRA